MSRIPAEYRARVAPILAREIAALRAAEAEAADVVEPRPARLPREQAS